MFKSGIEGLPKDETLGLLTVIEQINPRFFVFWVKRIGI
jgi:hypothetical protein